MFTSFQRPLVGCEKALERTSCSSNRLHVYGFRDPLTDRNCKATTARAAVEGIEGAVTIAVAIAASAAATSKYFEMSYKIPR